MRHASFSRAFSSFIYVLMVSFLGSIASAQPPQSTPELADNGSDDGLESFKSENSDPAQQDQGVEFLTRGPMHEAFAEPYQANPEERPIVAMQPPDPINELPPEYIPEGDRVIWIPGYWAWDDERTDFIWVSGVWREMPPGQQWIPGYWHPAVNGFQYVSGFWTGDDVAEVAYLPTPPTSLEEGPSSPAPGADYFYVPGSWAYQSNDYQWQPGYWSGVQENWVWIPSQYVWTPRGCVHQQGHWDYDVPHRGVMFSPVYYQQPIYRNPNYSYRPQYSINTGLGLFANLFVPSNRSQYYYGDYYGSQYANQFHPWVTLFQGSRQYDPFYSSYANRAPHSFLGGAGFGGTNFLPWTLSQHRLFAKNTQYRPARTISAQRQFLLENRNTGIDPTILHLASVGNSLANIVKSNDEGLRFQRLSQAEVDVARKEIEPLHQLGRERAKLENASAKAKVDADVGLDLKNGAKVKNNTNVESEQRGSLRIPKHSQSVNNGPDQRSSLGAKKPVDADSKTAKKNDSPGENKSSRAVNVTKPDAASKDTGKTADVKQAVQDRDHPLKGNRPGANRAGDLTQKRDAGPSVPHRSDDLRASRPENLPTFPQRDRALPIPSKPGQHLPDGKVNASPASAPTSPKIKAKPQSRPAPAQASPRVDKPASQNEKAAGNPPHSNPKASPGPSIPKAPHATRSPEAANKGGKGGKDGKKGGG